MLRVDHVVVLCWQFVNSWITRYFIPDTVSKSLIFKLRLSAQPFLSCIVSLHSTSHSLATTFLFYAGSSHRRAPLRSYLYIPLITSFRPISHSPSITFKPVTCDNTYSLPHICVQYIPKYKTVREILSVHKSLLLRICFSLHSFLPTQAYMIEQECWSSQLESVPYRTILYGNVS